MVKEIRPLVYVENVPAFLEYVRAARQIPEKDAMIRISMDGGQGSLKIIANIFSR